MIFLLRNHVTVKMINENTGKQKKKHLALKIGQE